ncbi:hypothetical protein [Nocardia sp. NPDC003963]
MDESRSDTSENAASMLQSDRAGGAHGIDLIGAWYAVGVTGHDQFRAFSLYECRGGWDGGWRDVISLYKGVPDSMFLSSIDDVRFQATSLPLVGAPGCPRPENIAADRIRGDFALLEIADVRPGAALDYLAAVRAERAPVLADHGHILAGLYEVAFTRTKAVSLWVTDIDGHVGVLRARDAALGLDSEVPPDERLLDWDRRAAEFHTAPARDLYLAAYPGPLLSPSGGQLRADGSAR